MDLIRVLLVADARRRWRSWLAVIVLTGVVGGVAMGAVAGWQRTSSAMTRFLDAHQPHNGYVEGRFTREDVLALDGVEAAEGGDYFLLVPLDADGTPHPEHLGKVSPFSSDSPDAMRAAARPIVLDGRLADPAVETEVVVDEEMAELYDLEAGDTLQMQGYGDDQVEDLFSQIGSLVPTGLVFDLTVTGIIRNPQDVVPFPDVADVVYLGSAEVYLGATFDRAHRRVDVPSLGALFGDLGEAGRTGLEVRLGDGADRAAFAAAVGELDPEADIDFSPSDAEEARVEAGRTIELQATLLLVFGGLVAIGGAALLTNAFRRQLDEDVATQRAMQALGMAGRESVGLAALKAAVVATAASVVAVGVAIALSPLAPVGHARRAEIDPGVQVDLPVLALGALVVLVLVVARVVVPAGRATSAVRHPVSGVVRRSGLSERASRIGLPPSVVAGVRAATLGTGGSTVAAIVFVAALGIVGGAGFAGSEARLASDPELWGWTFDAVVGDGNDAAVGERADETLNDAAFVEAYAVVHDLEATTLEAGSREAPVDAAALDSRKGTIEPALLEGVGPAADDEIALGAATARQLAVGIGDELQTDLGGGPTSFRVTGLVLMNPGYDAYRIGEGALFTSAGIERAGGELEGSFVLVDYAPGTDPDEAYAALRAEWGSTVLRPIRTTDVDQLHKVRHLPVWFSALLAVIAAVTLAFVLGLTIRRRRHDLALLRTLGFDGRQLRGTLFAQATTLVLPAALLGALAGLVVGRLAWAATASGLGAPQVHVLPIAALVAVVLGSLVVANVMAALPGRLAARTRPAAVLRTE